MRQNGLSIPKKLDLERTRKSLSHPIMFDGRNLFDVREMESLGFICQERGTLERSSNGHTVSLYALLIFGGGGRESLVVALRLRPSVSYVHEMSQRIPFCFFRIISLQAVKLQGVLQAGQKLRWTPPTRRSLRMQSSQ